MADLSLYTANTVRPGTLTTTQHTVPSGEAITAGAPCHFDATSGKAYNTDANNVSHEKCWGVALRTVAAGEPVTLLRRGLLMGVDVSAMNVGAYVYASDTVGRLADAAGTTTIVIGTVVPVFGESLGSTVGKGILVEVVGADGQNPSIASGATIAAPVLTLGTQVLAAAGSVQGDAGAITAGSGALIHATGADATKGIILPSAAAGMFYIIKNQDSANAVLKVYPGTSDAINALSANAAISMAAKTSAVFTAIDATTWFTTPLLPS